MNKLIAAGVLLLTTSVVAQSPAPVKSVNDGIFNDDQAKRGQNQFGISCTSCHDTAQFTGDTFLVNWTGKPLHELFNTMSTTMPQDNPGNLAPQQYADILAYFLKLNSFPSGENPLRPDADALREILVESPKTK